MRRRPLAAWACSSNLPSRCGAVGPEAAGVSRSRYEFQLGYYALHCDIG